MIKHTLLTLALLTPAPFLAGCSDTADRANAARMNITDNPNFHRYDVALPPHELLAVAQRVLSSPPYSIAVTSTNKGTLTTDWKPYQGAYHIVRYWQERTRFQVAIYPDFDDPTGHSSLRVTQETQTRASDQGTWVTLLDEDRSDRAADLALTIQKSAQAQSAH
ncbi:MAG TPA: hypothetical protein VFE58_13175 [Tepidisphaeraceae bacterium]|jgi:uncharacterized lipoprotein|nr:hypothetical protein [Tepidisphaeraceae bacterium]